ncbi:hypothetical protein L1887_48608 [Cichorium endivia]|nr:hypothetical protein L1887_48608 [Cichorium endivia]
MAACLIELQRRQPACLRYSKLTACAALYYLMHVLRYERYTMVTLNKAIVGHESSGLCRCRYHDPQKKIVCARAMATILDPSSLVDRETHSQSQSYPPAHINVVRPTGFSVPRRAGYATTTNSRSSRSPQTIGAHRWTDRPGVLAHVTPTPTKRAISSNLRHRHHADGVVRLSQPFPSLSPHRASDGTAAFSAVVHGTLSLQQALRLTRTYPTHWGYGACTWDYAFGSTPAMLLASAPLSRWNRSPTRTFPFDWLAGRATTLTNLVALVQPRSAQARAPGLLDSSLAPLAQSLPSHLKTHERGFQIAQTGSNSVVRARLDFSFSFEPCAQSSPPFFLHAQLTRACIHCNALFDSIYLISSDNEADIASSWTSARDRPSKESRAALPPAEALAARLGNFENSTPFVPPFSTCIYRVCSVQWPYICSSAMILRRSGLSGFRSRAAGSLFLFGGAAFLKKALANFHV